MYENFPKVTVSKGGTHFHARCILCGDSKKNPSKKRFHLDWNNGEIKYHCFNCERAGGFVRLYSEVMAVSFEDAKKIIYSYDPERIKSELGPKPLKKVRKDIGLTIFDDVLKECLTINDMPDGIMEGGYLSALANFIKERMVTTPVFVAVKGRYKGRVIIPVYKDEHIIYFQGRALGNQEPKYLNPVVEKSNVILNEQNFDTKKHIIVTEGLLDAFMIGDQGTSMLGASLSSDFVSKLEARTEKEVIIALDNDETGREKLIGLLGEDFCNYCKFFIMPYKYQRIKDLNELVIKHNILNVYDFVVSNSHSKFQTKVLLGLGKSGG
jgi:5S rRNA maturation endonuclease (ribonuclease M5)